MRLTKRAIDGFTYRGGWDVRWDDEVKGFGLRIYPSGIKSFTLRYAKRGGTKGTIVLGRYGELTLHEAREKARKIKVEVREGKDPLAIRQGEKVAPTMAQLADRYMDEHARVKKKPRSAKADDDLLRMYVRPALGRKKVHEVTRNDIARLHHGLRGKPYQANRVIALLSKMFNLAEAWGLRADGSNPCRHVQKYRERKVERFLSKEELERLGEVLSEADRDRSERPSVVAAIRLLMVTGCRLSEILCLRWEHVDNERRSLRLVDSKTGPRSVFLSPSVIDVLATIKRQDGNPHVIVGNKPGAHLVNLEKAWRRIRSKAGLNDVRLHDLRHTFASEAVAAGLSLPLIGKLLGHSQPATTQRYAHLADDPARHAAEVVQGRIADMMWLGGPEFWEERQRALVSPDLPSKNRERDRPEEPTKGEKQ